MLRSNEFGYAAVDQDQRGIRFESSDMKECIKYSGPNDLIVKRLPIICGLSIIINFLPWIKFRFIIDRFGISIWFLCILLSITKVYRHKSGMVVFDKSLYSKKSLMEVINGG